MRALAPGEVFRLHGDPHVERDFVFIDDVIDVFERSVAWRGRNDAFNLCLGRTTTLLDLAKAVLAAVGSDKRIDLDETFTPAAVRVRRSSCARLREAFELGPFTELAQGLPATVAWYRDALSA